MPIEITVEILAIGDELLYGHTLNTNSYWISEQLSNAGFRVVRHTTVGDKAEHMTRAFEEAEKRAQIVIITGGLGPTADDLTKPLLAEFFNMPLERNEAALNHITQLFEKRGFTMSERNRRQADLPKGCVYLQNERGTAPGMWFERNDKVFVSLPGVPHEMKHLVEYSVLPKLIKQYRPEVIMHRVVRTAGIGESWLADKISQWEEKLPEHIKLAYLPNQAMVNLRLTAVGTEKANLHAELEDQIRQLKGYIEKYIYGYDEATLPMAVGRKLQAKGHTIATAESCTAGFVAHQLTSIPGSSEYFNGGIVAYQNEIKMKLLNVAEATLQQDGAVSQACVEQMAEGVKKQLNTDWGVATSGIAGPGGGTAEKPVGLVWLAVSGPGGTHSQKFQFTKDRDINIRYSANALLFMLYQSLSEID